MKDNIIHSSIIKAPKRQGGHHNYHKNRKKCAHIVRKDINANPDTWMSKRDQESVCEVRTRSGLNCKGCKYYQSKYCLYDKGLL